MVQGLPRLSDFRLVEACFLIDRDNGRPLRWPRDVGLGRLPLLRHQIELIRHSAEFWEGTRFHLPHQMAAMDLHGSFADADIAGNLFAEAALRDLDHDLAFAGG